MRAEDSFLVNYDQLVAASKVEMSQVKSKRWPDAIDADGPRVTLMLSETVHMSYLCCSLENVARTFPHPSAVNSPVIVFLSLSCNILILPLG